FMFQTGKKTADKENELKWYHYLISLLFVAVGVVFIVYVDMDIPFICLFFTCVFAIAGIVSLLTYVFRDIETSYYRLDLVYGVMALFAALLFYTKQDLVKVYFPIIFGCILFANGVVKLQHSIDMKRIDRKMKKVTEMWLVVMIFALICIAAGSVAVYLTPNENRTLFLFVGISLVVAGVTDVFTHIVFNRKVKQFRSGDYGQDERPDGISEEKSEEKPEEKPEEDEAGKMFEAGSTNDTEAIPGDLTGDISEVTAAEETDDQIS
ncbi:MAG: DUF308 domain-containing protein, partial [Lachnospiraceae bacterium]|nr:DUF308 domain-containing protein [Lachnospiraceae bacterium]